MVCIAIDLKSFYASVECVDRGLDPLTTNLVVADKTRTDKTICLAVTPSLKSYGIPGRARLFEVVQKVREVNNERRSHAPGRRLSSSSSDDTIVRGDPSVALDYLVAPPRMAHYLEVSRKVYEVYLKYIAPEDIHRYSVDEVFIDASSYLKHYRLTAWELAMKMVRDVLRTTGITATAGIGSNLYLAKIAMDVEAKHSPADKDGVRMAELDEMSYRRKYWDHTPLTDFWRFGPGLTARLAENGMKTLGDIARMSVNCEERLYKLFGVNAELIIDHAWGWEPCTMAEIKAYRPVARSLSSGQVLKEPYSFEKAKLILREMADKLSLDLVEKGYLTDQITINIAFDPSNRYDGPMAVDWYGRTAPKPAHGTVRLPSLSSSTEMIMDAACRLMDRIADRRLTVRRLNIVAERLVDERRYSGGVQMSLFESEPDNGRERKRQEAILKIRKRFGNNAILKGMNFEEGATAIERNAQIGGHKA